MPSVTFRGVDPDQDSTGAIRNAILSEIALAEDDVGAEVDAAGNGWWAIKLTRARDRRAQTGVVANREGDAEVLRSLTRSLVQSLARNR